MIFYNAEDQILGRICSVIAKDLLRGEKVFVVNSEKAVIVGNPKYTQKKYLEKIWRGDVKHGPFFPKTPDGIFRRTVRGMLPWHKPKGRNAYRNLRVFIGVPEEFKNREMRRDEKADVSKLKTKYMTLGELSLAMGGKKRW
jgi:large subunit ribosomal protein L13